MGKHFSQKQIEHLAFLARLSLSADEKTRLAKELPAILEFVAELRKLRVENEEPFLFEDQVNVFREDEEIEKQANESLLALAPERLRQFFKVPRILR